MLRRSLTHCRARSLLDIEANPRLTKGRTGERVLPEGRSYTRHLPFIDRVKTLVTSGTGGSGRTAFTHLINHEWAGPGGGNGGRGGHVILQCDNVFQDLNHVKDLGPRVSAAEGAVGGIENSAGKAGDDLILRLPPGTQIIDVDTNEVVHDLELGNEALLLEGGGGGRGNASYTTAMIHSPREATMGLPGNSMLTQFELKVISDVGLIGFPNAGKSSLLGALTTAKPKVAPYAFSTLHPSIGEVHFNHVSCRIADLPGLIEGAFENRGLGHQFLRHTERTSLVAYVLDMSSSYQIGDEHQEPWDVLEILQNELEYYQPGLSEKGCCVLANKMDSENDVNGMPMKLKYEELLRRAPPELKVYPVSALKGIQHGIEHPQANLIAPLEYLADRVFEIKRVEKERKQAEKAEDQRTLREMFEQKNRGIFSSPSRALGGEDDTPPSMSTPSRSSSSSSFRLPGQEAANGEDDFLLSHELSQHERVTSLVDNQLDPSRAFEGEANDGPFDPYLHLPPEGNLRLAQDPTMRGQYWQRTRQPGEKLDGERW